MASDGGWNNIRPFPVLQRDVHEFIHSILAVSRQVVATSNQILCPLLQGEDSGVGPGVASVIHFRILLSAFKKSVQTCYLCGL